MTIRRTGTDHPRAYFVWSTIITNYEKVKEFHRLFNVTLNDSPTQLSEDIITLRKKLITEEYNEVIEAIDSGNIIEVYKELIDLLYVVYGTCAAYGLDANEGFTEVHGSNMTKVGDDGLPVYREDGKVLKTSNYRPADMERVINDSPTNLR